VNGVTDKVLDEIADVYVVSCQVAARYNVRIGFVSEARRQNHRVVVPQVLNLSAVIVAATVDENIHITPLLRNLEGCLNSLAVSCGEASLQELVNTKMAINRDRTWVVGVDGVGQHVD